MSGCSTMRSRFTEYLDGRLTGVEMQHIAGHIEACSRCEAEWNVLRRTQSALASLGAVPEPKDLLLRIRVAVSQERARRTQGRFHALTMAWRNSIAPYVLQAAGGLASAVLLIGTVAILVGIVAKPTSASAGDEPLGAATAPRFLYSLGGSGDNEMARLTSPVVVEAYVNDSGQVYDFRIVSGPRDPATRAQVENLLLESVFAPARFWGQPVRGLAVLSFSGVSVRG